MTTTNPTTSVTSILRTVLHVGCGRQARHTLHWSFRNPQWKAITVDVDPRCEPDVLGSMQSMPSVASGSVDAVFVGHSLEHIPDHEVPIALKEFLRVLKPDGDLLLQLPDLTTACEAVVDGRPEQPLYQSPGGPVCALDMIYGHRRLTKIIGSVMSHQTGFTQARIKRLLEESGYLEVKAWVDQYDLWATGQKPKEV